MAASQKPYILPCGGVLAACPLKILYTFFLSASDFIRKSIRMFFYTLKSERFAAVLGWLESVLSDAGS